VSCDIHFALTPVSGTVDAVRMSRAPAVAGRRFGAGVLLRIAAGALLAVVLLPLGATSAAAHGGTDTPAVVSSMPRVLSLEPAVPGLDVVVIDGGARLRLDNGTAQPVTVPGTDAGRPRVVPPGGSAAWTDARLGDPVAPPAGDGEWAVPLAVGDLPVTVRGDRVWPPAPHPFPWWALTVAALLGTYTVGGLAVERGRPGGARTALAGVVLVVTAAYVVHVIGSSLVVAEPPGLVALLGPLAAALTLRGHLLGPALYGSVGFLTALLTLSDTLTFHRAVLAFGGPFDLDRIATVITFGGGLGLFLVAITAFRRVEPEPDTSVATPTMASAHSA
jgi:hypothetical protein